MNRPLNKMPWITPHITVKDVEKSTEFYTKSFDFRKKGSTQGQDGTTWYAELQYKDQVIILTKEGIPGTTVQSPSTLGIRSSMNLYVYCDNVDQIFHQALAQGAEVQAQPMDQPWGDRICILRDPDNYSWIVATCKNPPVATKH